MSDTEQRLTQLENKVARLSDEVSGIITYNAVGDERHKTIVSRLDKIDTHINKLVWLILTGIIGAILAFLVKGGFNV